MSAYALKKESARQVARYLTARCGSDDASNEVAAALWSLIDGTDESITLCEKSYAHITFDIPKIGKERE